MSLPVDKVHFICRNCGFESVKWLGKCPSCAEWNTLVEEKVPKSRSAFGLSIPSKGAQMSAPVILKDIDELPQPRIITPDEELNRVLGGGIVAGSLILIGGEPGIGKSTLLLQVALSLTRRRILYVSGEESLHQLKMRASRIAAEETRSAENCYILVETNLHFILEQLELILPEIVIIDSIQTVWNPLVDSSPGSISQIKECTAALLQVAKSKNLPIFIIGHITKEGSIAGPKVLEHMVDTVIQFEGDRQHHYRILRTLKNRFGSTSEIGIYQMQGEGLRQVPNPSEILLSPRDESLSGISISVIMEGARVLLLESQALLSTSVYGTPQRSSIGFDHKRMSMLLAVLEKKCGFRLGQQDVFLNITGGIRVEDPSIDLGLVASILSSFLDRPVGAGYCFTGEIGLSGEIRAVGRLDQRIAEAAKLGFKEIFVPKIVHPSGKKNKAAIKVTELAKVEDLVHLLFEPSL